MALPVSVLCSIVFTGIYSAARLMSFCALLNVERSLTPTRVRE